MNKNAARLDFAQTAAYFWTKREDGSTAPRSERPEFAIVEFIHAFSDNSGPVIAATIEFADGTFGAIRYKTRGANAGAAYQMQVLKCGATPRDASTVFYGMTLPGKDALQVAASTMLTVDSSYRAGRGAKWAKQAG